MARPQENKAPWFSHNATLRNDLRIKAFRARHGVEGYGILMMLFEALMDSDFCWMEFTDEVMELLSLDFCIEPEKLKTILASLISLKIGVLEDGLLHCPILDTAVDELFIRRRRPLLELRKKQLRNHDSTSKKITADQKIEEKSTSQGTGVSAAETPISATETGVSGAETCRSENRTPANQPGRTSKDPSNADEESELPSQYYADLKKYGIDPRKPSKNSNWITRDVRSGTDEIQAVGEILKSGP